MLYILDIFAFYFNETISVENKNFAAQNEGFVRSLSTSTIILSLYIFDV